MPEPETTLLYLPEHVSDPVTAPMRVTQPVPVEAQERRLSSSERAVWLMDQVASCNGVQIARIRGHLPPEIVRACLDRLQHRHPFLRVRVVDDNPLGSPRPRFALDQQAPIPLQVLPREGDARLYAVVEDQVNRRFAPDETPLWRAVLLHGKERSELVLGHHHVLADALSAGFQIRDVLRDAAAMLSGQTLATPPSFPLRPSLQTLSPVRGVGVLPVLHRFLVRGLQARLHGRPRRLIPDSMPPPGDRRTRLLHYGLSSPETAALAAHARAHGTTLQGALGAALLVAAAADLGLRRPATLGFWSAVNLRDRMLSDATPLGDEVGLYVSQATTYHQIVPGGDLWALARDVRAALIRAIDDGEPWMTFPWLGLFVPGGRDPARGFVRRIDQRTPAAVGMTNVGRLPLQTDYGPLTLEALEIAIGLALVTPLAAAVTTLSGALSCNLIYVDPLISPARAARIGDDMMAALAPFTSAAQPGLPPCPDPRTPL